MLDDLFGFGHSVLLALDAPTERLFAIASSGYARSAVGADVDAGTGLIGTAAGRRRLIVPVEPRPRRAPWPPPRPRQRSGHRDSLPGRGPAALPPSR